MVSGSVSGGVAGKGSAGPSHLLADILNPAQPTHQIEAIPVVPSLSIRRRKATEREVAACALTLFEAKGVAATSVQEIVKAAGVSERTFFRYFEKKESCVLIAHVELKGQLQQALEAMTPSADVFSRVGDIYRQVLTEFDAADEEFFTILQRVDRLKSREPLLLQAGLGIDAQLTSWLTEFLRSCSQEPVLHIRLFAEKVGVVFRQALQLWADRRAQEMESAVGQGSAAVSVTLRECLQEVEEAWDGPKLAEMFLRE